MTVYESTAPRGGGATVAAMLIAALAIVGWYTRPLMAIDETRYAAVALEMLHRGDWLVPHLNGETYSHKPPLLFWIVAAGWSLVGVSELWARLVGPLAGVVALVLVSRVARVLWPGDARTRGWAPLITAGALLWGVFGSLFMFDTLLACAALVGVIGVYRAVELGQRRGVVFLATSITLGILAKGPVILLHVLPVALAAPWWATPRPDRRWRTWYLALTGALLLGAGGALLWAIPAGIAGGPAYQRAIFLGQTAGRMTKSFAHGRGVWWYVPLLPALLFPWFLWPESWRAVRALRLAPRDAGVRFCVVWAASGFLAFSLVSGKQMHYLLPLLPAGALLIARGLSQREAAPLVRPWLVAGGMVLASAAVLMVAFTTRLSSAFWWPHPPIHWWWVALPLASAVMLLVWQRGRITRNAAVHALAGSTVVMLCGLQLAAGRAGTLPYDTTRMAAHVRAAVARGTPIAMLGAYNGEYHFAGRLQGVHIDVVPKDGAASWAAAHPTGLVMRYDRGRTPVRVPGIVAQYPFRNGWVTLSAATPLGASAVSATDDDAPE